VIVWEPVDSFISRFSAVIRDSVFIFTMATFFMISYYLETSLPHLEHILNAIRTVSIPTTEATMLKRPAFLADAVRCIYAHTIRLIPSICSRHFQ
jgi:hypothetical protein